MDCYLRTYDQCSGGIYVTLICTFSHIHIYFILSSTWFCFIKHTKIIHIEVSMQHLSLLLIIPLIVHVRHQWQYICSTIRTWIHYYPILAHKITFEDKCIFQICHTYNSTQDILISSHMHHWLDHYYNLSSYYCICHYLDNFVHNVPHIVDPFIWLILFACRVMQIFNGFIGHYSKSHSFPTF